MQVASFVIACAAFVVGGASLAWQIISWLRSGPVIVVEANQGFPVFGTRIGDLTTHVVARNRGRAAATVNSWAFELPDGNTMFIRESLPWSAALPHRLEPHAEATWYVDTRTLQASCAEHGIDYQSLRAFVRLGNGRPVYAKRRGIGLKPG